MRIPTVVVDDEPLARRRLVRLLEAEPDIEVAGVCADGREALDTVRDVRPALLFLDVQMPEMDGFAVLRAMGEEDAPAPQVVFVTAYDRYAIQAFEVHALDYLLKPYTPARLKEAVSRAVRQCGAAASGEGAAVEQRLAELLAHLDRERREGRPADTFTRRILVKEGERMFFVPVERIDWLEAEGNYVRLHAGQEAHLVRGTMGGMEEQLDPGRFTRIHRSTIVNVDRVKEVRPWFAGDYVVKLHDGQELRLSRRYRDRLL